MTLAHRLSALRLVVVTGKGGVGKTALVAALGTVLRRAGRRVLLLEMDPRENLHEMFGLPPSAGEQVDAGPGLVLQNVRPRAVMEEVLVEHVRVGFIAKRVLASPIFQTFADSAPGLSELAILLHARRALERAPRRGAPPFDTVVLDAPATGHGLALLAAPQLVAETITDGPFGRMASELAQWVDGTGTAGVVVATRAEELPVEETLELLARLAAAGRPPAAVVVNALYPPFPADAPAAACEDPALGLWRARFLLNVAQCARLADAWPGPRYELPLLAEARGPRLTAALADALGAQRGMDA